MAKEVILSPYAQRVKKYYDLDIWRYEHVENAYNEGKLTEEEFREITQKN